MLSRAHGTWLCGVQGLCGRRHQEPGFSVSTPSEQWPLQDPHPCFTPPLSVMNPGHKLATRQCGISPGGWSRLLSQATLDPRTTTPQPSGPEPAGAQHWSVRILPPRGSAEDGQDQTPGLPRKTRSFQWETGGTFLCGSGYLRSPHVDSSTLQGHLACRPLEFCWEDLTSWLST